MSSLANTEVQTRRTGKFHVYGSQCALTVEPDVTEAGETTCAIDGAPLMSGRGRRFNWSEKIRIRLNLNDFISVAPILFLKGNDVHLTHYGKYRNKSLEIRKQDMRNPGAPLVVRLTEKDKAAVIAPVPRAEVFRWQALVISVIKMNWPALDGSALLAMIKIQAQLSEVNIGE